MTDKKKGPGRPSINPEARRSEAVFTTLTPNDHKLLQRYAKERFGGNVALTVRSLLRVVLEATYKR